MQDARYSNLIDEYFREYPMPRVSWIQDINCRRYEQACESLLEESGNEKMLEIKHVSTLENGM